MKLPQFRQAPQSLWSLLRDQRAKKYLCYARQFNLAVAYASFQCHSETLPGHISDMRIQGAAYVATGGIRSTNVDTPKFAQVCLLIHPFVMFLCLFVSHITIHNM